MPPLQQTGESSENMIILFFVYFMSVHAVLLSVSCWAWRVSRVRRDYEKLISLTVRCAASETSRELRAVAELLNEYNRDALKDALSKWGEPISGIKVDLVSRLINSKKGSVVDERTAMLMSATRQHAGHKIPLEALLDSNKAQEWLKAAIKKSEE